MRINVDDIALRDPDINRRLPRFTGLSRFDAFGRLVHVWGLAYDRRSAVLLMEDVDDVAEHDGFAAAMVLAEIADQDGPSSIRVHGVEDRIAYLVAASESGKRGGTARAKQAERSGGKFTKGPTSGPLVNDQGSTKGDTAPPLDSNQTSGSAPSPAPDPAQISLSGVAHDPPAPPPQQSARPYAPMARHSALAVELLNAARAELDPTARPVATDPAFEHGLAGHLRPLPEADREPAIRHGVAAIAEAVRVGDETIGSLRPGELAGPRSWAKWQAAPLKRAARGRDGPGGKTGQAKPAASHGTELLDPQRSF